MFAYCLNNPTNYIDWDGKDATLLAAWATSMWWLSGIDLVLPIGDLVFTAGVILLGLTAIDDIQDSVTEVAVEEKEASVYQYKEHTKGARQSTKGKHQKGQSRKNRDKRGEKGDARRYYMGNKKKPMMLYFLIGDWIEEETDNANNFDTSFGVFIGVHSSQLVVTHKDY